MTETKLKLQALDTLILPAGTVVLNTFGLTAGSGVWQNTAQAILLPEAGKYSLDCVIRVVFGESNAGGFIAIKLVNVTTGGDVPGSNTLCIYNTLANAWNQTTVPVMVTYSVDAPTWIQLYGMRVLAGGTSISQINADANGLSTMRYVKVGPYGS